MLKSNSPDSTKKAALVLAEEIMSARPKTDSALVIGLVGDLGAGKTTFVQGFAKRIGIRKEIKSPTFLMIRRYEMPAKHKNQKNLFHIDAYRLEKPKELLDLGFREIIKDPKNIILLEWAEKAKKILPSEMIWVIFRHGQKESERFIELRNSP